MPRWGFLARSNNNQCGNATMLPQLLAELGLAEVGGVPHPIAAEDRLEGRAGQGWRVRYRRGDATGGSALDRPALEGYTIGSG